VTGTLSVPALLPVVESVSALREALAGRGRVGLVPTMGYLHSGHATLIEQARRENDVVVVSVFVNPLQFGPKEDLSRYPRDLENDRRVAGAAGADLIFHPSGDVMYPAGFGSGVSVGGVSRALEGASRPGHFDGVATVVLKLLNLTRADRAYFGEKDWQQLAVVRQLVRDLNVPVQVVGVPTVRASGGAAGLALSSRNSYLTAEQQVRATVLSRALRAMQGAFVGGEREVDAVLEAGLALLRAEPEVTLDYLSVVDDALNVVGQRPSPAAGDVSYSEQHGPSSNLHTGDMYRVLIAARMFGVRLIDNMPLDPRPTPAATGPEEGTA